MWISPVTLQGRIVRLEPLETRHAPDLLAAADPELFRHTPQAPREWSVAGFEQQIATLNARTDVVALAIVMQSAAPRTWTSSPRAAAWRSVAPGSPAPTRARA